MPVVRYFWVTLVLGSLCVSALPDNGSPYQTLSSLRHVSSDHQLERLAALKQLLRTTPAEEVQIALSRLLAESSYVEINSLVGNYTLLVALDERQRHKEPPGSEPLAPWLTEFIPTQRTLTAKELFFLGRVSFSWCSPSLNTELQVALNAAAGETIKSALAQDPSPLLELLRETPWKSKVEGDELDRIYIFESALELLFNIKRAELYTPTGQWPEILHATRWLFDKKNAHAASRALYQVWQGSSDPQLIHILFTTMREVQPSAIILQSRMLGLLLERPSLTLLPEFEHSFKVFREKAVDPRIKFVVRQVREAQDKELLKESCKK